MRHAPSAREESVAQRHDKDHTILPSNRPEIWVAFWLDNGESDIGKIDNVLVSATAVTAAPFPAPAGCWRRPSGHWGFSGSVRAQRRCRDQVWRPATAKAHTESNRTRGDRYADRPDWQKIRCEIGHVPVSGFVQQIVRSLQGIGVT